MVPTIVRSSTPTVKMTTSSIIGIRVEASALADSGKLLFSITVPDNIRSILGYFFINSSLITLADDATSGISLLLSMPGVRMVTLTTAASLPIAISFFLSKGSFNETALIRRIFSSLSISASKSRSSMISSSPSA